MIDLTTSRIESKYLLDPRRAEEVVARFSCAEPADYGIVSLYLDRRDRALSWEALRKPERCAKLRVREYLPDGSPFAWVEIKRRVGEWREKRRFKIARALIPFLLENRDLGPWLQQVYGRTNGEPGFRHAYDLVRRTASGGLIPVGTITVHRRVFALDHPPLRLTLDRDVAYHAPPNHGGVSSDPLVPGPVLVREPRIIVEIKHRGRFPAWWARAFEDLTPAEYSKFRTLLGCVNGVPADNRGASHVD
ncbi:MAG: VTC domain-containing protein [Planctomycetes bacterium]|nr:VTC domain-containing protein [Planctomycetota bacterium]